jgi:hypothetical protein
MEINKGSIVACVIVFLIILGFFLGSSVGTFAEVSHVQVCLLKNKEVIEFTDCKVKHYNGLFQSSKQSYYIITKNTGHGKAKYKFNTVEIDSICMQYKKKVKE